MAYLRVAELTDLVIFFLKDKWLLVCPEAEEDEGDADESECDTSIVAVKYVL